MESSFHHPQFFLRTSYSSIIGWASGGGFGESVFHKSECLIFYFMKYYYVQMPPSFYRSRNKVNDGRPIVSAD